MLVQPGGTYPVVTSLDKPCSDHASPWAYNGKLFCLNEDGETFVFRAGRKFDLSHVNSLGDDDMAMASPAIAGNRLLIRTAARLYCLGE